MITYSLLNFPYSHIIIVIDTSTPMVQTGQKMISLSKVIKTTMKMATLMMKESYRLMLGVTREKTLKSLIDYGMKQKKNGSQLN